MTNRLSLDIFIVHLGILVQTEHYQLICRRCLYKFDQFIAVSHLALSTADKIGFTPI
jgi:hypothetical protein